MPVPMLAPGHCGAADGAATIIVFVPAAAVADGARNQVERKRAMTSHHPNVRLLAAAALSFAIATPAAAGGDLLCCGAEVQVYVVNQGPLFSGPGHYLRRESPDTYPGGYFGGYPYVEPPGDLNAPSYFDYRMHPGRRTYPQLRGSDAQPLAR